MQFKITSELSVTFVFTGCKAALGFCTVQNGLHQKLSSIDV